MRMLAVCRFCSPCCPQAKIVSATAVFKEPFPENLIVIGGFGFFHCYGREFFRVEFFFRGPKAPFFPRVVSLRHLYCFGYFVAFLYYEVHFMACLVLLPVKYFFPTS